MPLGHLLRIVALILPNADHLAGTGLSGYRILHALEDRAAGSEAVHIDHGPGHEPEMLGLQTQIGRRRLGEGDDLGRPGRLNRAHEPRLGELPAPCDRRSRPGEL